MPPRWVLLAVLAAPCLCGAFSARAETFIVRDGEPNAEIVIAAQPTRMQDLAARELRKYIEKITGARLSITAEPTATPVKVYVGKSVFTDRLGMKDDDLDYGAYRVVSGADYLVLFGRDRNYFMDKPGQGGPEYPKNRGDRKRAGEAWTKKYGDMWASPFVSSFKSYHEGLGVWAVDEHGSLNAVNDFLRSLGLRWYAPGDFGEVCPSMQSIPLRKIDRTVRPEFGYRYMRFYYNAPFMASEEEFLWQLRLGFYPDLKVRFGHGIIYVLRPQDHPKFFALYGGKRANQAKLSHRKPCLSSEGLLRSSVGFAKLMFDEYDKKIISLMPSDGYTAFCQCELCKGKDTPERGYTALMSDYVWDFIDRAAGEVAKTHPGKEIWCQAYGSYRLPPLKIDRFHPNVAVSLAQQRYSYHDPERRRQDLEIREGFLEKIPSRKFYMNNKYSIFSSGGIPAFCPKRIAEDLKSLKGVARGENMEVRRGFSSSRQSGPDPLLATNHLNCWITARMWIEPGLDVEAILNDYYRKFYGPAAEEMKGFVEFCEQNWWRMGSKKEPILKAFDLIEKAGRAAGEEGSIYAKRVRWIADYMKPMRATLERLRIGREKNPVARFAVRDKAPFVLDGSLNDAFWKGVPEYNLGEMKTGAEVQNKTRFKIAWADGYLYFGVRCDEPDMANLNTPAGKDGDNLIFSGDGVEIMLDPPSHAGYYQIAIDPLGHVTDLDRLPPPAPGRRGRLKSTWDSGIEAAMHRGDDHWIVEARLPVLGANQEDLNPDYGVSGDKPSADAPWYFNVCRVRIRQNKKSASTLAPNGGKGGFHNKATFARLIPQ